MRKRIRFGYLREIGARLKRLRKQLGFSRLDFAARLGITRNALGKNENGHNLPDLQTLYHLAEDFNVSMDWLLLGKTNIFRKQLKRAGDLQTQNTELKQRLATAETELKRLQEIEELYNQIKPDPEIKVVMDKIKELPLLRHEMLAFYHRFMENRENS